MYEYQFSRGEGRALRIQIGRIMSEIEDLESTCPGAPRAWTQRKLAKIREELSFIHERFAKRFPTPWHTKYRGPLWWEFKNQARS